MLKLLNKKIVILSVVLTVIAALGLVVFFSLRQKEKEIIQSETKQTEQEILAEKQLKELEELRNKAGIQSLTEEQMLAQQKELESLRKKAGIKPLTQSQIQKPAQDGRGSLNEIERQLDELENLRQVNE